MTVLSKRRASPEQSYTALLFKQGVPRIAKKLGEETTEAIIEAVKGDKVQLKQESADVLYHMFVLWAASGITPDQVAKILEKRMAQSGLAEKASRKPQAR